MTNIRSLVVYIMVGEPIDLTLAAGEQKLAQLTGILGQSKEKKILTCHFSNKKSSPPYILQKKSISPPVFEGK